MVSAPSSVSAYITNQTNINGDVVEGAQTCFFDAAAQRPDFPLRFPAITDDIEQDLG